MEVDRGPSGRAMDNRFSRSVNPGNMSLEYNQCNQIEKKKKEEKNQYGECK